MMELTVSAEQLGVEIRELTRQAKAMTLYYGVEIGRRLAAAKQMVAYGTWGDWIKQNTEFSQPTATRFIRLFEEYGAVQIGIFGAEPESSTLKNLSISNALRLLAVPEDEREEFAEAVDAENLSARELDKAIKERQTAIKEREAAQRQAQSAELRARQAEQEAQQAKEELERTEEQLQVSHEERRKLADTLAEVKRRQLTPIRDEDAIREAAEKAKAAAEAAIEKKTKEWSRQAEQHRKETERLQKELAAALEKARTASDAAEKQTLRDEIDALRKKLSMADREVTAAGLYFGQWQSTYNQLTQTVERIEDAEKAEKLRAAIRAQLGAWMRAEGEDG